jgi:hypothetical protein
MNTAIKTLAEWDNQRYSSKKTRSIADDVTSRKYSPQIFKPGANPVHCKRSLIKN